MPAPRVLIVEDSIVSAMMMEATIERKQPDAQVRVCRTLKGGLRELLDFRPHVVLLDLGLPDSPEGNKTVGASPSFAEHANVLAVSGRDDLRDAALKAGAKDFFLKGFATEDALPFIDRVTHLLPC